MTLARGVNKQNEVATGSVRPPERIQTERLLLRRPVVGDAETLFHAYGSDPDATRYLTWRTNASPDEMRAFLVYAVNAWDEGTEFCFVIAELDDEKEVGMISFKASRHGPELGYVLSKRVWGRGYATEATQALVGWLVDQPGIYRVWAFCDAENKASERVLEKAGLQREAFLRRWIVHPNISDAPRDVFLYGLVK